MLEEIKQLIRDMVEATCVRIQMTTPQHKYNWLYHSGLGGVRIYLPKSKQAVDPETLAEAYAAVLAEYEAGLTIGT